MKKLVTVIFLLLMLLMVLRTIPTYASTPTALDFGTVTPVKKTSKSLPFFLPVTTAPEVFFECSGLSSPQTGNRIPTERISFSCGSLTVRPNQKLPLSAVPAPVTLSANTVNFLITIDFMPSDAPGEYGGMVYAVFNDSGEKTEPIPIWVNVRVSPWTRIETALSRPTLVLNDAPSFAESALRAIEPVKILLASNAPWRLYVRAGNTTPVKADAFPIHIGIGKTITAADFTGILFPNGKEELVAFGPSTVVGDGSVPANYWTELYFTASIIQWRQYPSGTRNFSFYFNVQTTDD